MQRIIFLVLLSVSLYSCKNTIQADKLYFNAQVWTGDKANPTATCVGIKGNKIVYVGNDPGEVSGERIDLNGQMLIPGFQDNHTHFLTGGYSLASVQLKQAKTKQEFINILSAYCKKNPDSTWIQGGDWDHEAWGGELPTRQWIDSVTGDHPVFLTRYDGHMALANSKALRLAMITKNTMDPIGGKLIRDGNGEPTGVMKDEAFSLISPIIPPDSESQLDAYMERASKHAVAHGITQVHDVSSLGGWTELETYQRAEKKHAMRCRIYAFVPLKDWKRLDGYVKKNGRGDDMLHWGALKGFVDGSLGSTTAWFYQPYRDDPKSTGLNVTDTNNLREWVLGADKAGLHIAVHAIGDRANDFILSVYDQAEKNNPKADHRFRIEHTQHISATGASEIARLHVIASMQPYHLVDDGNWAFKRLDEERLKRTYAFKSIIDKGGLVCFGSDWTVAPLEPLLGIHAAVNRQTGDGKNPGGWLPEQKISAEQALMCYTVNNAYAAFQEEKTGKIKTGMLADMTVLDKNILTIDPNTIKDTKVTRTIVDGKEVYAGQ